MSVFEFHPIRFIYVLDGPIVTFSRGVKNEPRSEKSLRKDHVVVTAFKLLPLPTIHPDSYSHMIQIQHCVHC